MPWAPASRAIAEKRSTLGIPSVRVFRRVAILLMLTESFVTRRSLVRLAR